MGALSHFSFTTKRGNYIAELGYSFSVAGILNSGRYKREFPTQQEADEFVRDLQDKAVAVHYNPAELSSSALLEPDIKFLLQIRAPSPAADYPGGAELGSRLDQTLPLASVGSSRGSNGKACGTGSFFLDVARGNLRRVVPRRFGGAKACREFEPKRFVESRLEGFARLDALHGVRIFRLRLCEFSALHRQDSERQQRHEPTSLGLARFLGSLDVALFGGARHSIHRCSCGGYEPALRQRAFGIAEFDLLPQVWPACNASSLASEIAWQ